VSRNSVLIESGSIEGSSPGLLSLVEDSAPANLNSAETVRMWPGGPLRQYVAGDRHPGGSFIRHGKAISGGFVGSYVCDACRRPAGGLYSVAQLKKWVCGGCRTAVKITMRALGSKRCQRNVEHARRMAVNAEPMRS
jgi:hypothetical protein